MKKSNKKKHQFRFVIGDLYLFRPIKKHSLPNRNLWGIYDKIENGIIYLESSSLDLEYFKIWCRLPAKYRYSRRATRNELRDYMYNMGRFESKR